MKSLYTAFCVLAALFISSPALAANDCNTPMAQWQPREQVIAHIQQFGITVQRLRIDDGCYKANGEDEAGNRVELQIEPGTLAVMELEVKFRPGADTTRYLAPKAISTPSTSR